MKTVNEFLEQYKDYKIKDEEAILELLERPRPKTVWDLQDGDEYWFVDSEGAIDIAIWEDCKVDNKRRKIGNCYLTKEKCEFALEKKEIIAEMKRLGGTENMMSLGDSFTKKYSIEYSYGANEICIASNAEWGKPNNIYFLYEEQAQKAIDTIGEDRLKKYIFYVNE